MPSGCESRSVMPHPHVLLADDLTTVVGSVLGAFITGLISLAGIFIAALRYITRMQNTTHEAEMKRVLEIHKQEMDRVFPRRQEPHKGSDSA